MIKIWEVELRCYDGPLKKPEWVMAKFIAQTENYEKPDDGILGDLCLSIYWGHFKSSWPGGFRAVSSPSLSQPPNRAPDGSRDKLKLWFVGVPPEPNP